MEPQRKKIDAIDDQLLGLLNQRAQIALQIAREKSNRGLPVSDPTREAQVIERLTGDNAGPLSSEAIARIYKSIMAEMRSLQETQYIP